MLWRNGEEEEGPRAPRGLDQTEGHGKRVVPVGEDRGQLRKCVPAVRREAVQRPNFAEFPGHAADRLLRHGRDR